MDNIKVISETISETISDDNPKKLKTGWTISENTVPHYLPSASTECYDFIEADKYKDHCGKELLKRKASYGHTSIHILEFLWGQPYNNLALNYIVGLEPSSIRVTEDLCALDCRPKRVTVFLEEDKRTIRKICLEIKCGLIGCDNGYDLQLKFNQQKTGKKIEQFDCTRSIIDFTCSIMNSDDISISEDIK